MTTLPRPGAAGAYDLLVGPGATPAEEAGAWASASIGAVVGGLLPRTARERVLGAVFGFDAGGGLWVNESYAGKQWYRRPEAPAAEAPVFAAFHVHPFVVEAVGGRRAWWHAIAAWALPVAGSAIVAAAPAPVRRPTALVAASIAAVIGARLAPSGWRWLPPLLAFKLVVGHATDDGPLARALGDHEAA